LIMINMRRIKRNGLVLIFKMIAAIQNN